MNNMNNSIKEYLFPIKWMDFDDGILGSMLFYEVEFLEDFGSIPKGKYDNIMIDYRNGEIQVYDSEDNVLFVQTFKYTIDNE